MKKHVKRSTRKVLETVLPERAMAQLAGLHQDMARRRMFGINHNPSEGSFDRPSAVRIGRFGGFEVAYRHGTADQDVIMHSFDRDIFFTGVPEYRPEDGHVILDVGAHIGTFSLLASSKVSKGAVYAIEPSLDSFNFLRINAALNRASNIHPYHLALSDKNGTALLSLDPGNWGNSTVAELSSHSEEVECWTLSKFLDKASIGHCSFMKLNCEGAEFPLLLGSPRSVLQRFQMILVLYHCDLWTDNTDADLIEHLRSCGFGVSLRNQTEKRGWIVATRLRE